MNQLKDIIEVLIDNLVDPEQALDLVSLLDMHASRLILALKHCLRSRNRYIVSRPSTYCSLRNLQCLKPVELHFCCLI